jgi:hypothetical protein
MDFAILFLTFAGLFDLFYKLDYVVINIDLLDIMQPSLVFADIYHLMLAFVNVSGFLYH